MLFKRFLKIILLFLILWKGTSGGVSSHVSVDPLNAVALVGSPVRFNCTAFDKKRVDWERQAYGTRKPEQIYNGEKPLFNDFGRSGRFDVIEDESIGRYDLIIKDVITEDAGMYSCIANRGIGSRVFVELIVSDEMLCDEHFKSDDLMGENQFNLHQDVIRIQCTVKNITGNKRTALQFSFDQSIVSDDRYATVDEKTKHSLRKEMTMGANKKMDGTVFMCRVILQEELSDLSLNHYTSNVQWKSKTIRVKYAMLKRRKIEECPDDDFSLECNPPCSYSLENFSNGTSICHNTFTINNYSYNWPSASTALDKPIMAATTGNIWYRVAIIVIVVLAVIALVSVLLCCWRAPMIKRFLRRSRAKTAFVKRSPDLNDMSDDKDANLNLSRLHLHL